MMRSVLPLAALLLLASLPTSGATHAEEEAPTCLPLGQTVQCATDLAIAVILATRDAALCVLGAPPATYPDGLTVCVPADHHDA